MRIGLVTDTHLQSTIRELWDEVRVVFAGADLILHAGDIVSPRGLDWLEEIAPTLAAFPRLGQSVLLEWQQNNQNFVITDIE